MKKKVILGIIIALLVICVAVEGFFIWKLDDNKKNEKKEQTEQVGETPSPEPTKKPSELPKDETLDGENLKISKKYSNPDDDELVYTYLTVNIEEKSNNGYKYKYEVPQINLESEEVEKINKEILKQYEDKVDEINTKQEIDFGCEGLSYEYYENDGILSLVMKNPTEAGGYFSCKTYNIDISERKEINNVELLKRIDIAETDLNDKILKAIDNSKIYKDYPAVDAEFENFVKEQKDKTTNKYKNISADKAILYVNDKNNLCAYLGVYALAGGETMTIILDLETSEMIEIM